jgi:hypothetical protein
MKIINHEHQQQMIMDTYGYEIVKGVQGSEMGFVRLFCFIMIFYIPIVC